MGEQKYRSQHADFADRSHEEVRKALPEYVTAMALGQAPQSHFPHIAAHLEHCAACRAELDQLVDLVAPAYGGQIEPADQAPQFDLSFLQAPAQPAPEPLSSWWMDAGRLILVFSESLLQSMRQPALLHATRGQPLYRYTPQPPPQLGLTIDVFADDEALHQGNVQVLLDVPDRDPLDQSGMRVALRVGDLLWEGATGATGSVTFASVPLRLLPQLRIEITLPTER